MGITLGWILIHDISLIGNQLLVPIKYLVKSPLYVGIELLTLWFPMAEQ